MASTIPCPSCGAQIAADAAACDLCGYVLVESTEASDEDEEASPAPEKPPQETPPVPQGDGASPAQGAAYCTECGTAFEADDRFCRQCGAERPQPTEQGTPVPASEAGLPTGKEAAASSEPTPSDATSDDFDDAAINRKLMWVGGGAVLLIAVLFGSTLLSERGGDPLARTAAEEQAGNVIGADPSERAEGEAAPMGSGPATETLTVDELVARYAEDLSGDVAAEADSLQAAIEQEEESLMQQTIQQELVNLYIGIGDLGRAAQEQHAMATATNDPDAWRRTGDLLYSWMEQLGQGGTSNAIPQVAPHVVDAYQEVLDQEPDNLDVRTDMATAMLQTDQPMRGVDEINRVIEDDPEHFQARFNRGIMHLYIGRVDEAVEEFEAVKDIVGSDSPYYERADQAITLARQEEERVREEGGTMPEGEALPSPGSAPTPEADDDAPAMPTP